MIYIILLSIFTLYFLLSFYASRSLKTLTAARWIHWTFWGIAVAIVLNLLYHWFNRGKTVWSAPQQYAVAGLLTWLIICLFVSLPLFIEDITRLIRALFSKKKQNAPRLSNYSNLGYSLWKFWQLWKDTLWGRTYQCSKEWCYSFHRRFGK